MNIKEMLDRKKQIETQRRELSEELSDLDNEIGLAMGTYKVEIPGIGLVQRSSKKRQSQWDNDALLRTVLDTRLVNESTGEVLDESPLDKVLKVWNLGTPRKGILKERGIQADEFCVTENLNGWSIRIY